MRRAKIAFRATVWVPILVIPIVFLIFRHVSKKQGSGKQIRGSELVTPRRLNKLLKKEGKGDLQIGQVKLPKKLETEHCCFIGRTGTGKTTALYKILQRLRERNERAIIYDFKGDYIEKFYDSKRDKLFNPFDRRTINWSIFNEVEDGFKKRLSINAIANSLIPDEPAHTSQFWAKSSRGVLAGILLYLCAKNKRTNKDLWDMCCEGPEDLKKKFREVPESREYIKYLEGGSKSVRIGDMMATFSAQTEFFSYLVDSSGTFSFKDWVVGGKGFLFIANKPSQQATLKPLVSFVIDIMLTKSIDLEDNLNRRIFLLIDEFGTLQNLPCFTNFLSTARSKGGSVWCGLQDLSKVKKTYGEDIASSIFNNFTTLLSFAISDPKNASYIAKAFGQREVLKMRPTMQVSDDHVGHGSLSENKIEELILPSEIQNLSRRKAYLKISGYPMTKVKIPFNHIPNKAKAFEPREVEIKTKNKFKPNQVDFNNSEEI